MQIIEIEEPNSQKLVQSDLVLGIDFGTTNSLAAVSRGGIIEYILNKEDSALFPSLIKEQNIIISSIKRLLGKSLDEITYDPSVLKSIKDLFDYDSQIPKMINSGLTLPELAAKIFIDLKEQAERQLSVNIKKIVVTVPAYFDDAAKGEIILAAKIAGLEILRVIAEPTAAAYAYGLNRKELKGHYLVYDLGGGTFDVSLLNMQKGVLQVKKIAGNNTLGGDDIDKILVDYLIGEYKLSNEPSSLALAKQIKEYLSYHEQYENMIQDQYIKISLEQFNSLIVNVIETSLDLVDEVIDKDINIEGIILIGGSTRIPLIAKLLSQEYDYPILQDIDPDKAVVAGAALQAENLSSNQKSALLIDVVPLSLGLELQGGVAEKIINRNSPVPLSVTKQFTTQVDNQTAIWLHIIQGEREFAKDCRSLAKFELKDIPLMKAGVPKLDISFAIDVNGILSISAFEKVTNKSQSIIIKPTYGLDENSINELLSNAYINAEDDFKAKKYYHNREEVNKLMINAKQTIELNKIMKLVDSKFIDQIKYSINELQKYVSKFDYDKIDDIKNNLKDLLKTFINLKIATEGKKIKGKNINDL